MFKLLYQHSFEVDAPLKVVWDTMTNFALWPKWNDRLDFLILESEFVAGRTIKSKMKKKKKVYCTLITEVVPNHKFSLSIKTTLSSQNSCCSMTEITPDKTLVQMQVSWQNILVPLIKKKLLPFLEKEDQKTSSAFKEYCNSLMSVQQV